MTRAAANTPINYPQPTRLHYAWSCLLIFAWLTFAGCTAVWLFSPEPLLKVIAMALTSVSLLLALLQYYSTFRYHREATIVAMFLYGTLRVALFLSVLFMIGSAHSTHQSIPLRVIVALLSLALSLTLIMVNVYHYLTWSEQLYVAQQSNALPSIPQFVTLRKIFLLVLVISWVIGIASLGVRNGWQTILFF
ncbi:hypothetical protein Pan97_23600 [Bremerella volcania]|uniref:Uncharacterized protein n=1 Tax=Bremerella volcania TaxID=2527984 RepID=A0A518C802_9BACT|nr:hypothetical protein [Bremerella volcania]QDU75330.1 hypothetical protein Pan97_23600 [Bremerella volcania]